MKKVLIVLCASFVISCTYTEHSQKGKKQLENMGYTNVVFTGYSTFCCDEKDNFSEGFTARAKDGSLVSGCICSGMLKGITVRFE